jgi:hypothetical protein
MGDQIFVLFPSILSEYANFWTAHCILPQFLLISIRFCLCSLVGQLLNCRDVLIPEHTFLTSGSLPIKFLESFSSPSPFSIPFRLRVENSQTPPVIPFPLYFSENKKIKKMRPISIQRGIHVYLCNFKFLIRETSFTSLEVLVVLQP